MISRRQLFLQHVGQTSSKPLKIEIEKARGIYMYTPEGERYVDMISGFSVSNLGHSNPKIIEAIQHQIEKHMHLTVYGAYVQAPQVQFAKLLISQLPENLSVIHYGNSGTEAIEGALKVSHRFTNRTEVVAFKNAYHGSTLGALSICEETFSAPYNALLSNVKHLNFNCFDDIWQITEKTSCVVVEPIQAEGGIIPPKEGYLQALRNRCNETGTLLVFDEIQTGFGRTGKLFAFQRFGVVPDIFTISKAMGGGMPIGAFVSSPQIMKTLIENNTYGHITTFGGHPVSAAAALASLKILLDEGVLNSVDEKGQLFIDTLQHTEIKSIRGFGLFLSIELENKNKVSLFIERMRKNGYIFDNFLFETCFFRIAPPLTITKDEIKETCIAIKKILDTL